MTEEQKDQETQEVVNQETESTEQLTEESSAAEKTVQKESEETVPNVDERGVEWKNVAMEEKRKRETMEDRIERLEQSQSPYVPPQQQMPQQPKVDQSKVVEKFAGNIDGYLDNYYDKRRHKERVDDAISYVTSKGLTVKEVDRIAYEYGISSADPMKMVKSVERILKATNKPEPAPKPVNKEKEAERVKKIKQNTTESGSRPSVPKPDITKASKERFLASGEQSDLTDYFRKQMGD